MLHIPLSFSQPNFLQGGAYCLCFHALNSLFHSLHSVFSNLTRIVLKRFPITSFLTDGHFLDPFSISFSWKSSLSVFPPTSHPVLSQSPLLLAPFPFLMPNVSLLKVWAQPIIHILRTQSVWCCHFPSALWFEQRLCKSCSRKLNLEPIPPICQVDLEAKQGLLINPLQ